MTVFAIFYCMILLVSTSSTNCSHITCPVPKKQPDTPIWATVFIHGAIKAEWIFNSLYKVVTDSVEGSTYEKAVNVVRNDPFFFHNHAMQEQGLRKIDLQGTSPFGARGIAQLHNQITALAQKAPTINYYYTYGWSGLMSSTQRFEESQQLYDELTSEMKKIHEQHHVMPHIRLIAYSHGGNVCLNLAHAKKTLRDLCLYIDELILIGSPIQTETDYLVADPMFKKVYNFYSPGDMVQPSDFFSAKGSRRTFKPRAQFSPPDKLKQICVKIARYTPRKQSSSLPRPLPLEYKKSNIKRRSMNPGHIELWYLGWTVSMYRNNFPLHPLPVVDFVSFITAQVDQEPSLGNNIIVTLQPQKEIMRVKNKYGHEKKTLPFIPFATFEAFQKDALAYKPNDNFYKERKRRFDEALRFARASKHGGLVRILKEDGSYYKISKAAMCLH